MNTGLIPLVRRALIVAAVALSLPCFSQGGNNDLTKDFSKLSAKERTKIAAQENQAAAVDTNYQAVMRRAESAFQGGDYQKALASYEDARKLRPYNVYPKVKIQDLQELLKKNVAEKATQHTAQPGTTVVGPEVAVAPTIVVDMPTPISTTSAQAPVIPPVQAVSIAPPVAIPRPIPEPVPEKNLEPVRPAPSIPTPTEVARVPAEAPLPKIMGERIFLQAGAVVTERTVIDDDRPTVYRRVVHPSGQVFTFKDGLSIPERMWKERFGD